MSLRKINDVNWWWQDVATFWQGGDYHGSGKAVGNIVRMIMFGNKTYSQHVADGLEGDISDMLG